MTVFTPNEIAALIYLVGDWGPGSKAKAPEFLDVAIAVCLAESGGKDDSFNPPASLNSDGSYTVPSKYAVGLWQIMYPDHKDVLDQYASHYSTQAGTSKSYTHPLVNTAAARDIQKAQGWAPWTTFTHGAYKAHLGYGKSAYEWISKKENLEAFQTKMANYGMNFTNKTVGANDWRSILFGSDGFTSWFADRLKEMGISIGVFLVGLVLVILGVWFLLSQSSGKIASLTPEGALAKGLLQK